MPSIANGGISRNLQGSISRGDNCYFRWHAPPVQFILEAFVQTIQYTEEMYEDSFPDIEFKFVHQVHNEHRK